MRCLCCGKIIEDKNDNSWHLECIKKFFDTYKLPLIDLSSSNEELLKFGENYVSKNDSVTGVQTKLSLHLSKDKDEYRLTLVGYPAGYILKPETKEYPSIARAEHLVMSMANECSIKTPMHALIKLKDNSFAYITKRIDRRKKQKIHMEDFCQLSNRLTEDKYHSSYEKVAKVIECTIDVGIGHDNHLVVTQLVDICLLAVVVAIYAETYTKSSDDVVHFIAFECFVPHGLFHIQDLTT